MTESINLGERRGHFRFRLPCHSFLGHWKRWMLDWAWHAQWRISTVSRVRCMHVGGWAYICTEATDFQNKTKQRRMQRTDRHSVFLFSIFTIQQLNSEHARFMSGAIKCNLSFQNIDFHLRALCCYTAKIIVRIEDLLHFKRLFHSLEPIYSSTHNKLSEKMMIKIVIQGFNKFFTLCMQFTSTGKQQLLCLKLNGHLRCNYMGKDFKIIQYRLSFPPFF